MDSVDELTVAAQEEWLERFSEGPTEPLGPVLAAGTVAPNFTLLDETGRSVELSGFWAEGPALIMFWRHFGCSCGIDRAQRLLEEVSSYAEAGLNPVIVAQGEPERSAVYKALHSVPCPILSDPDHEVYQAYGVGQFAVEQIFYAEGDSEFFGHERHHGVEWQKARDPDRPLVDDPWRATAEFVVGKNGFIRLAYAYQWCEDYPNPGILTAAAHLSSA